MYLESKLAKRGLEREREMEIERVGGERERESKGGKEGGRNCLVFHLLIHPEMVTAMTGLGQSKARSL